MARGSSHTPWWAYVWIVLGIVAVVGVVPLALRHVETPSDQAYTGAPAGTTDPAAPAPPQRQLLAVLGDAFTAGGGANAPEQGFATLTANQLGWSVQVNGQAATGYTTPGAGPGTATYRDRVLPVVNGQPTVVVVQGGSNDIVATPGQIQAAAADVFTSLRTGLPQATIVAVGPVVTRTTTQLQLTRTQQAISAAAAATGVTYVDPTGWLDPTDVNLFSQGFLPSQLGHQLIADRLSEALRTLLAPPAPVVPPAPAAP